jgi:hypothetical protein
MTRQPLHIASDQDRKAYRKSMRALAGVYGTIVILAIAGTPLSVHSTSDATNTTPNSIDVASLTKIDR